MDKQNPALVLEKSIWVLVEVGFGVPGPAYDDDDAYYDTDDTDRDSDYYTKTWIHCFLPVRCNFEATIIFVDMSLLIISKLLFTQTEM